MTTPTVRTAPAALLTAPLLSGPPPHLDPHELDIDVAAAASMVCGSCNHHGLAYYARHSISGAYHVEGICPRCGAREEI